MMLALAWADGCRRRKPAGLLAAATLPRPWFVFGTAASARMGHQFAFTRWRMVDAALLLWGMALATGQWRSLWSDGGSAAGRPWGCWCCRA